MRKRDSFDFDNHNSIWWNDYSKGFDLLGCFHVSISQSHNSITIMIFGLEFCWYNAKEE